MIAYKLIVGLVASAILVGCSSEQLPVNARVSIAPGSKHFDVGATFEEGMFCFKEGGLYLDIPLLISVTDDDNAPVGHAEVGVYADYAENSSNAGGMLELYADYNGNGVVDAPEELVSGPTSGVYKVKTDQYHGTAFLLLRMYLTCPYEGDIYAYAGYSTYRMQVGVSYGNAQTTETTGGETTGGETTGDTTGGETGGETTGDTTGGETGGETTGDTTGGETGGETTGDTTGGETGGETTGDTTGGETGGETTEDTAGSETGGQTTGEMTGGETGGEILSGEASDVIQQDGGSTGE